MMPQASGRALRGGVFTNGDDTTLRIKFENVMERTCGGVGRRVMGHIHETFILFLTLVTLFLSSFTCFKAPSCKLWRTFNLNEMHKPGDVILGGLFRVHYSSVFPEWAFTSEPEQPVCSG